MRALTVRKSARLRVVRCERHVSLDRDASFHSGTLVRDLRKRGYGEL
jgi:hypothetical protein